MKDDDQFSNNLFRRIEGFIPSGGIEESKRTRLEDFCTESLAWCLKCFPQFQKSFVKLLKQKLTSNTPTVTLPGSRIGVHTQRPTNDYHDHAADAKGRFDLVLQTSEWIVVIECKIKDELKPRQINDYRHALGLMDVKWKRNFLVALTEKNLKLSPEVDSNLNAKLRWADVHECLRLVIGRDLKRSPKHKAPNQIASPLEQFAEYLELKGLNDVKIPKYSPTSRFRLGIEYSRAIREIMRPLSKHEPVITSEFNDELWVKAEPKVGGDNGYIAMFFRVWAKDQNQKPEATVEFYLPKKLKWSKEPVSDQMEWSEPWSDGDNFGFELKTKKDAVISDGGALREWFANALETARLVGKGKSPKKAPFQKTN